MADLDRDVTFKELRTFVRSRASEAAVWAELDKQMADGLDLARAIAEKGATLDALAEAEVKARASIGAAKDAAARILTEAKSQAAGILADANGQHAKAEAALRAAQGVVTEAKAEAAGIVEAAKVEAGRLTNMIDEIRRRAA